MPHKKTYAHRAIRRVHRLHRAYTQVTQLGVPVPPFPPLKLLVSHRHKVLGTNISVQATFANLG